MARRTACTRCRSFSPAWVSWRSSDQYIGWAPLPPIAERVYEGQPITGSVDVDYDIGPACYNFVEVRYFGEPVLWGRLIRPALFFCAVGWGLGDGVGAQVAVA